MNYLSQQNPEIFNGKRIIVRVDFNVPLEHGTVSESEAFRIHAIVPTIQYFKNAGAKIILISHIGRGGDSLAPVVDYLAEKLPELGVQFIPSILGEQVEQIVSNLQNSDIILLENIRQNSGEEKNDAEFGKKLASYADYYVNDAFAVSHRAHASVVGIAKHIPSFAGLLLESEIKNLNKALKPESPSVLIMAGIKFETKLPLIEKLLPFYDSVLLGGGLLNTYLKVFGLNIGTSVFDDSAILSSIIGSTKLVIPEKVVIERGEVAQEVTTLEIQENDTIVDVVIDNNIKELLNAAQTVVWNGPLGWYEKGYTKSTIDIIENLGPKTDSIVGGGDTVTVIRKEHLENNISFLSTGGGAMLEYLQQGTLCGIDVLQ
jgi:phosphoglycerate kinase